MQLRLQEFQDENNQAWKIRTKQPGNADWNDVDGVLHYQGLFHIPEMIQTELISRHHDDPLAGYFDIKKTRELIAQKYYWPTLCCDVKNYVRGCNVCLTLKAIQHKPYGDL